MERLDKLDTNTSVPNIFVLVQQTVTVFKDYGLNWEKYPYDSEFTRRMLTDGMPSFHDWIAVAALTLSMLLFRVVFDPFLKKEMERHGFRKKDINKLPESLFRFLFYAIFTLYGGYTIIFSGRHTFFHNPCAVYDREPNLDVYFSRSIPFDLKIIYGLEFSFFVSCIYMILFLDEAKKDDSVMLCHHVNTLLLIFVSYIARYYKCGCLIFVLHDISDAILEFGKLTIYFNGRKNRENQTGERFATAIFVAFGLSWFYLRIYQFPIRVLHSTNWCAYLYRHTTKPRLYLFFNALLFALYAMQLIWFWFILKMAVRLLTKKGEHLEDIREDDTTDKEKLN